MVTEINLHLSKKALFINIGDESMTEKDINELINKVGESIISALQ